MTLTVLQIVTTAPLSLAKLGIWKLVWTIARGEKANPSTGATRMTLTGDNTHANSDVM